MAAPALNVYEYQYTDTGFRLNSSVALPFVDVTKVQGLDLPNIDSIDSEYDSRHGGYVYARFTGSRTIIIDGILYANANTIDTTIETLLANFTPRRDDDPFYYRGAGVVQRYIMCKPVGLHFDIDRLRSVGSCGIQIQLKAGDPVKYVDKASLAVVSNTTYAMTNVGTAETFPVFEMDGGFTNMSVTCTTTGETVTLGMATDGDDEVVIDMKAKAAYVNGVNRSRQLSAIGWWSLEPGKPASFRITGTGENQFVNADCENNFTGLTTDTDWSATQRSTDDKHSGSCSLKMTRTKKTTGAGNCFVPSGVSSLPAGRYNAWVWLKGTMTRINIQFLAGSEVLASVSLAVVSNKAWKKFSLPFTTTATKSNIRVKLSDDGGPSSARKKGKVLYIDDFGLTQLSATDISGIVYAKDGWL